VILAEAFTARENPATDSATGENDQSIKLKTLTGNSDNKSRL